MKGFYPEGAAGGLTKRIITPTDLAQAQAQGSILEATVTMCDSHHNMTVDLGCMKGIIPREEGALGIAEGTTRDIALISRVGRPVCFTVTAVKSDEHGRLYALLSRRCAQEMCRQALITENRIGDIIDARITHLESFGVFCDIGCGIIALLPIDSISVSRISHPHDRFSQGQDIRVIIKSIAPDGKITLSHKELLGTWEENSSRFLQGQTVSGIIRSVEEYGVFVELSPNLAGLAEPRQDVFIGQRASVYIKSINPDKMKIKLIIIDSFDDAVNMPCEYFIQDGHIDSWCYSPAGCYKKICTEF